MAGVYLRCVDAKYVSSTLQLSGHGILFLPHQYVIKLGFFSIYYSRFQINLSFDEIKVLKGIKNNKTISLGTITTVVREKEKDGK